MEPKENKIEQTEKLPAENEIQSTESNSETKTADLAQLEEILEEFEAISQLQDPEKWYKPMAKKFLRLSRRTDLSPSTQSFFAEFGPIILENFKEEISKQPPENQNKLIDVLVAVKGFAEKLQSQENKEKMPFEVIPFEKLAETGKIALEKDTDNNVKFLRIEINGQEIKIPVPKEGIFYKGGVARVLAKIFTNSSLEGESTRMDIDLIVQEGTQPVNELMSEYKTNLTDTEIVLNADIGRILATRDVDMNAALISKDGLILSEAAKKACQTRVIHPLLPKERELFGKSTFKVKNVELTRNVLLYRLVRMIIDKKADALEVKKADAQVPLGIYWLILARHYINNPERSQNIECLFNIAQEMGQTGETKNPIDWLKGLLEEYPEFNLKNKTLSEEDYARWLFKKFLKLVKEKYKKHIRSFDKDFEIQDWETAFKPVRISRYQNKPSFNISDNQLETFLENDGRQNQT